MVFKCLKILSINLNKYPYLISQNICNKKKNKTTYIRFCEILKIASDSLHVKSQRVGNQFAHFTSTYIEAKEGYMVNVFKKNNKVQKSKM